MHTRLRKFCESPPWESPDHKTNFAPSNPKHTINMAKIPAKKAAPATSAASAPKVAKPKKEKAVLTPAQMIETACEEAVKKLRALNLDVQLQGEIDWCLASFKNDGNPVGLYIMIERALPLFNELLSKKTKGVTAKFVADLEKALASR